MNKREFCDLIQTIIKEVRVEYDFTQEQMAYTLGLSKKTLVQIEKSRSKLGWAEAVTFCTIFEDSEILIQNVGSESKEIIQVLSLQKQPIRHFITMGGEIWWKNKEEHNGFVVQQHKLSKHYRILDHENYRVYFSLSYKDTMEAFKKYTGKMKG